MILEIDTSLLKKIDNLSLSQLVFLNLVKIYVNSYKQKKLENNGQLNIMNKFNKELIVFTLVIVDTIYGNGN